MNKQNSSGVKNAGCCKEHSCTQEELTQYRQDVKTRIAENDGTIFPNNCPDKTAVVLQEFIRTAKERVCIYCGHLNAAVYKNLQSDFEDAIARDVEVRVICAPGEIGAKELAEKLNRNSLRIDTHKGNVVMRRMLEKHDFKYCGIIFLQSGEERVAYEKII